jgi:hypothetical protein
MRWIGGVVAARRRQAWRPKQQASLGLSRVKAERGKHRFPLVRIRDQRWIAGGSAAVNQISTGRKRCRE